jgi:hypothetical protein
MQKQKLVKDAPHQKYLLVNGEEVPGGSTICKIGQDAGGLIHWAWDLGKQGKDYRTERDNAADVGTIAHFMCEAFLNGFVCDLSDYKQSDIDKALVCYNKFVDWWEASELEKVATEIQLVHENLRYGGTIDLIAKKKSGEYILIDLKTSKKISDSYVRQLAGYTALWQHNNPEKKISDWCIVRIGKLEEGDFEVKEYTQERIEGSWNVFQKQVDLYWSMKNEKPKRKKK